MDLFIVLARQVGNSARVFAEQAALQMTIQRATHTRCIDSKTTVQGTDNNTFGPAIDDCARKESSDTDTRCARDRSLRNSNQH